MSYSRLEQKPVPCAYAGCRRSAAIIHSDIPYCGKHALEAWDTEGCAKVPKELRGSFPPSSL